MTRACCRASAVSRRGACADRRAGRAPRGGLAGFAALVELVPDHGEAHRIAHGDGLQLGEHLTELLDGSQPAADPAVRHEPDRLLTPLVARHIRSPVSTTPGTRAILADATDDVFANLSADDRRTLHRLTLRALGHPDHVLDMLDGLAGAVH
jgi:hypothetical protein